MPIPCLNNFYMCIQKPPQTRNGRQFRVLLWKTFRSYSQIPFPKCALNVIILNYGWKPSIIKSYLCEISTNLKMHVTIVLSNMQIFICSIFKLSDNLAFSAKNTISPILQPFLLFLPLCTLIMSQYCAFS